MRLPFSIFNRQTNNLANGRGQAGLGRVLTIDSLEERLVPVVQPIGLEFIINDVTAGSQRTPAVAMNDSGDVVISWQSEEGLYAERFIPTFEQGLGDLRIDPPNSSTRELVSVDINDVGEVYTSFAMVLQPGIGGSDVYSRNITSQGFLKPANIVNATTNGEQRFNALTILPDGNAAIAWYSDGGAPTQETRTIMMQIVSESGQLIGPEVRVDVPFDGFSADTSVAIDSDDLGNIVVFWQEQQQQSGNQNRVVARWFSPEGTPTSDIVEVGASRSTAFRNVSVAVNGDGIAAFAWSSSDSQRSDGGPAGVYARVFGSDRLPLSNDLLVAATNDQFSDTSIGFLSATEVRLAWDQPSGMPNSRNVLSTTLNVSTMNFGSTEQINTLPIYQFLSLDLATNDSKEFVVVWAGLPASSDPNDQDIFARWYRDTNAPPIASAGGPYVLLEGQSLLLDASNSSDTDSGVASISWDINGDGMFGDATGVNPTLTWAELVALGIDDGPGSFDVRVQVTDVEGAVSISPSGASVLTVQNVAPTLSVTSAAQQPNPASITLNVTDPSPFDQAANFTFMIDWENDGVFEETVSLPNGSTVTHAYPLAQANYTVAVKAIDKDGGVSNTVTRNIQTRRLLLVDGIAYWSGSVGADRVRFIQEAGDPTRVRIIETLANGAPSSFNVVQSGITSGIIVASGVGGNDEIDASGLTVTFARLSGGEGSDIVIGGGGADTIDGGSSADTIRGGGGNDQISGGAGDDLIYGEYPTSAGFSTESEDLGSDTIDGGDGVDTIYGDGDGGEGAPDSILGGAGNDVIYGDGTAGDAGAADTIYGGADDDLIYGEPDGAEGAIDRLYGDEGQDTIYAGGGNDFVYGGDGDDILLGGDGAEGSADAMDGGTGRDILIGDTGRFDVNGNLYGGGADTLKGGADDDIIVSSMVLATAYDILVPIHSEWRSTERNYETRVDNILGFGFGPRNNGDSFLLPGDNIRDDVFADRVFGEGGLDLFLVDTSAEDLIGDLSGEIMIEL